jgi:hypothetical protein
MRYTYYAPWSATCQVLARSSDHLRWHCCRYVFVKDQICIADKFVPSGLSVCSVLVRPSLVIPGDLARRADFSRRECYAEWRFHLLSSLARHPLSSGAQLLSSTLWIVASPCLWALRQASRTIRYASAKRRRTSASSKSARLILTRTSVMTNRVLLSVAPVALRWAFLPLGRLFGHLQ